MYRIKNIPFFLYNLSVYKSRLDLITNALCNIAESSSPSIVASIRNERLNKALILGGIAAMFQFIARKKTFPDMM